VLISVVITVRNEENDIADLMDSLVVQEKPLEIIVVDANSEDMTRDIVKRYADKYDFVRLFVKGGTRGEGRNFGVAKSSGDYVAFIDGDEIVNPFWMSSIRKSVEDGHEVIAGKTIQIGYHAFEKLERVELVYNGYDITYPSCNLVYKKSLFNEIGGFDKWFRTAEDIDLNLRAVEHGAEIHYNENAIVYHRTRGSFYGFFKQAFWNGYGRKQLTLKHGKLWAKYSPKKMIQQQIDFWSVLRLCFAFYGYLACKLFDKRF
jgi:glycosyltransferase involved in cell wall biosynthesis